MYLCKSGKRCVCIGEGISVCLFIKVVFFTWLKYRLYGLKGCCLLLDGGGKRGWSDSHHGEEDRVAHGHLNTPACFHHHLNELILYHPLLSIYYHYYNYKDLYMN